MDQIGHCSISDDLLLLLVCLLRFDATLFHHLKGRLGFRIFD
jgi:hypothetical protein